MLKSLACLFCFRHGNVYKESWGHESLEKVLLWSYHTVHADHFVASNGITRQLRRYHISTPHWRFFKSVLKYKSCRGSVIHVLAMITPIHPYKNWLVRSTPECVQAKGELSSRRWGSEEWATGLIFIEGGMVRLQRSLRICLVVATTKPSATMGELGSPNYLVL